MIRDFVKTVRQSHRLVAGGMFFFESPGHMLSEIDYLLRLVDQYPLIRARMPIVMLPPVPMALMLKELIEAREAPGVQVFIEKEAAAVLREIQLFHPDLVLDIGMAHWKLTVGDKSHRGVGDLYPLNFGWAQRRDEFIMQMIRMHEAWNVTRGRLPLREGLARLAPDPEFGALLDGRKYAVIQIKARIGNGTVRLLPGNVYAPALARLKDEGYALILAGREPMLEEFKRFDVYDYPRSKFVSPRHDFFLFGRAGLGLVSPSGAGLFCDTLGVPCCQIGSWTLIPHPSEKTVAVPTRLRPRTPGAKILTFAQQAAALHSTYDEVMGPACFDAKKFEDLPPAPEDIAAGVAETLHPEHVPGEVLRSHAQALRRIDPLGMWKATASRMASTFLGKYPDYLN